MVKYCCDRCGKQFGQKGHYNTHMNKKNPCIHESKLSRPHEKKALNSALGQYFTTDISLKEKVFEFIQNRPSVILEPSIGQGDLVSYISTRISMATFDMYEIDNTIPLLDHVSKDNVIYADFTEQNIQKTYMTIIGNPPYVKNKTGNLYIDFTEKCYRLLASNGELIFIVPSDFLKLTSAARLLNEMMSNGTFTHIFHPHNEKLFENASIDVIVFRYCKDISLEKKVLYNDDIRYITNSSGLITFHEEPNNHKILFHEYFDIYVGIVSGKEEVYKNEDLGTIQVVNGENKIDKYIYIENYPCDNDQINDHLLSNKPALLKRGIRKFNENNWFEFGATRNMKTVEKRMGKDCIYMYNLTRKANIAFQGKVQYFGGGLIILIPKRACHLPTIAAYLNSDSFKHNFLFSGRFKIGHRQISNSFLPDTCLT
jgi:adenine-specific DNA-methyltransferase